ncbi:hypothetical protein J7L67_09295 [bacterium]|nr:hypothetical protein [bacterium]
MKLFHPDQIIVEQSVKNSSYTKKLLSKFNAVEISVVSELRDTKKILKKAGGKPVLLITNYKGNIIKKCPGSKGVLCCNYYVANLINGCPFKCSYCILQDYLNCGSIMLCANIDSFFDELKSVIRQNYILRLGTGELADSLAFEPMINLNEEILPRLKNYPNIILELKTKSANIESVLKYGSPNQVVVGWSLNPQEIIDSDEINTASLEKRLTAAKIMVQNGYKVTFHFDPIILIDSWETKYAKVIDKLKQIIPPEKIAWLSLGGLRFSPSLKRIIQNNRPYSKILSTGEFVMCNDSKFRYFRPIRIKMYKTMIEKIFQWNDQIPVYLCMETNQVWKEVFGYLPSEKNTLSYVYSPYPRNQDKSEVSL